MEKPKKLLLPDHSFGNDGFYVIYLSKRGSALYGVCSKQDPSLVIFDRVQIPEIDGIVFEFFEPSKSFSGRYILLNDTNNF